MRRWTITGGIDYMGMVAKLESQKHQSVPQNPPDMNKILEIYLTLIESDQGLSQPQLFTLPRA